MTIRTHITDPVTNLKAEVVNGDEHNGLVVATRPLKTYKNRVKFFVNDTYGIDMNQNAEAGGTPIEVHNGNDDTLWTGTSINGTTDFTDTAQNHTPGGNASIGFDAWSTTGNTAQIAKGSDQDLTGYTSISLWVYVRSNWSSDSISFYGWDTGTGVIIGVKVLLEDYINVNSVGVWQKAVISLSDLGLTNQTIDSFRLQYEVKGGASVNFYIDDIQIEESGTPIVFNVKSELGKWIYAKSLNITLVDALNTVLLNNSMPNLSYNKFMNENALPTGLRYNLIQNWTTEDTFIIKQLSDALQIASTKIKDIICDGTNTLLTIESVFSEPICLKWETEDKFQFVVNDDLTGLIMVRASLNCYEEQR